MTCSKLLSKRAKSGPINNSKDVLHYLIGEGEDTKMEVHQGGLLADTLLIIVAGSDTTSSSVTILLYFLLTHPHVLSRVVSEVDAAFESQGSTTETLSPDWWSSSKLSYLEACVNEGLRLYPAVPNGSYRWSGQGKQVGDKYIPPRTTVSLDIYSIHRDSRYFGPDPDAFRPERWLSGEPINRGAFIPFSTGPRGCVGKALAMQEMKALLSSLLRKFEFHLPHDFDAKKWQDGLSCNFVMAKDPLRVSITERKHS